MTRATNGVKSRIGRFVHAYRYNCNNNTKDPPKVLVVAVSIFCPCRRRKWKKGGDGQSHQLKRLCAWTTLHLSPVYGYEVSMYDLQQQRLSPWWSTCSMHNFQEEAFFASVSSVTKTHRAFCIRTPTNCNSNAKKAIGGFCCNHIFCPWRRRKGKKQCWWSSFCVQVIAIYPVVTCANHKRIAARTATSQVNWPTNLS